MNAVLRQAQNLLPLQSFTVLYKDGVVFFFGKSDFTTYPYQCPPTRHFNEWCGHGAGHIVSAHYMSY